MNVYKVNLGWFYRDEDKAKYRDVLIPQVKELIGVDLDPEDSHGHMTIDSKQLMTLIDNRVTHTVENVHPLSLQGEADFSNLINKLSDKINAIPDVDAIFNNHCELHIPNMALLTYNDVMLLEDSCTDDLQKALDSGWRIIACCPQSQRRPDYILGRFNPEIDYSNKDAKRGNNL